MAEETERSEIVEFYAGKSVFITGASGYVGTLLVEKLLRSCKTLKTLFLLFRGGKDQNLNERIKEYFNDDVFTRMKMENPTYAKQVHIVQGDLRSDNYGMTLDDQEKLIQDTNVIFHVAATVRFDERIRLAYEINVKGTRTILSLAEQMRHLESFVYVSTAYSNNELKFVQEKVYSPLYTESELLQLVQGTSDTENIILNSHIIGKKANTYTLTKSISESMVYEKMEFLPISIIRPSIIIPTFREPLPLYYKGLNSFNALSVVIGSGILRILYALPSIKMDLVPGDKTNNAIVALGWYTAASRKEIDQRVFNFVSVNDNPVTFREYSDSTLAGLNKSKENNDISLWKAHLVYAHDPRYYYFLYLILHLLPCLVFVPLEMKFRKKSVLMKVYRRIWHFKDVMKPFSMNEWQFVNNNTKALLKSLSAVDKDLFDFDLKNFEWLDIFSFLSRSFSFYTLKQQITKECYNRKMYYIEIFEMAVCWLCGLGLSYYLIDYLAKILNTLIL